MATFTQANRSLSITTPLGKDALLLTGFRGNEAISELFDFYAEMLAENSTVIDFDKIIGQSVTLTIAMPNGQTRYLNGIVQQL